MIRKALNRLWNIITFPFRLFARPFRAIRDFINQEPEDTPVSDVVVKAIDQPSVLIEHLEALRLHLIRSLIVLAITIAISTTFAGRVLEWLATPIGGTQNLQAIEVTESIGSFMRVTLLSGFALALPYIGIEIFAFVNPGLKRRERTALLMAIPFATLLFLLGMAFAFKVMLPVALPWLLSFLGITTVPRPSNYIRFVTGVMFWIGIAFQFPLIIYMLARLGVVRARTLADGWRFAVLAIAVLAAAVTPTVDPVNMAIVMAPMVVLYFVSIGLAAVAQRRYDRSQLES
ncbi:MAG: twin-arginine translocase subunit TatC, partial [Anaerolineales bacterium]|nr:twin-arginine translocase subunit TatC [Anaerolineales bacterium]